MENDRVASSQRKQEERYAQSLKKVHATLVRLDSNGRNTITLAKARPTLEFGLQFLWTIQWCLKPENVGKPHARSRAYSIWLQIETRELLMAQPTAQTRARIEDAISILFVYVRASKKNKDLPKFQPCINLFKDLAGRAKELGY